MPVQERQHVPDILECLAQLSSDEVPTPPKLANAMLDLLPDEVWTNPNYRWCDPCSKSGVFLREIAKRLLFEGLVEWEPDFEKRREHIFRNMLFGCGITELTGIVSRRTVYYSRHAATEYSVIRMDSDDGNIPFVRAEHDFKRGRCTICSAPEDLERGPNRENYAYAFIHGAYPTEELTNMKFDVIVGNPPYQLGASGGAAPGNFAMPVYQKFVEQAIDLDPEYIVMITPSRWFAGGRGLDDYRARMLGDKRIRELVDFPDVNDCFPGADISGGVSYFLWDRAHSGDCRILTKLHGKELDAPEARALDEHDIFVRYNTGADIVRKVWGERDGQKAVSSKVSPIQPFSIRTNFKGAAQADGLKEPVALRGRSGVTYIERSSVPRNIEWVDQWKVLLGNAFGDRGAFPYRVTSSPIVLGPGTACTETYLVIDRFASEDEAKRFAGYLSTRFVRFVISLRKNTQHMYSERFAFVPDLPMDREWTDANLYERYGLTDKEIAFVESQVKAMPPRETTAA
jgi:Eco57I restriction-modification methylase